MNQSELNPQATAPTSRAESRLRLAILGAGYVGSALAAAASTAGHDVWAVRRSSVAAASDGVRWVRGDVTAGVAEGLPDQLDGVILTIAPSHDSGSYDTTYPPAARAALALSRTSGAHKLLYTSSTGVYGGRDGAWVAETSARAGTGDGNAALIAAEDVLLDAGQPGVTVLRVAGIYGPGRDPRARMHNAALLPQRGEYWTNLAHRDDIVGAVLHVITLAIAPHLLNISDNTPTRAADVARWLTATAGGDPARLVFGNDGQLSRNNQRVSSAAVQATGWKPKYPSFREGFRDGL